MWPSEKYLNDNYQKPRKAKNKEFFKLVAEEALDYIESNSDILFLEQFLVKRRISTETWRKWRQKSEHIQKAHELIMMELSSRVTSNGVNNTANAHFIKFLLPRFGQEHKEHAEYMSRLQRREEDQGEVTIIKMAKLVKESDDKTN